MISPPEAPLRGHPARRDEAEREQEHRQRQDDVDRARDDRVDLAPVEARQDPERDADERREAGREEGDEQGRAGAVHDPDEQVAPGRVGTEPVLGVRTQWDAERVELREVHVVRVVGERGDDRCEQADRDHHEHDDEADEREPVPAEAPPEQLPGCAPDDLLRDLDADRLGLALDAGGRLLGGHLGHVCLLSLSPGRTAHLSPLSARTATASGLDYTPPFRAAGLRDLAIARPSRNPCRAHASQQRRQPREDVHAAQQAEGPRRARALAERLGPVGLDGSRRRPGAGPARPCAPCGRTTSHGRRSPRRPSGPRSILGRTSPKNARSISSITVALVLGPAVVGRDVGPLDVDVERVEPLERVGRERRPGRVVGLRHEARGVDRRHPEQERDAAFDGHLDETSPCGTEPLLDRLQRRPMVTGVAREDEVGGEPARPASRGVHLRGVQDPRRTPRRRRSSATPRDGPPPSPRGPRTSRPPARTSRGRRRATPALRYAGSVFEISADRATRRRIGSRSTPRCSTVARSSKVASGSSRRSFTSCGERARLLGREIPPDPPVDDARASRRSRSSPGARGHRRGSPCRPRSPRRRRARGAPRRGS